MRKQKIILCFCVYNTNAPEKVVNNSRRSWLVSDIEATCAKSAPTMVDGSSLMSLNDIFRDESVREKVILENIRHRKGWQDLFCRW